MKNQTKPTVQDIFPNIPQHTQGEWEVLAGGNENVSIVTKGKNGKAICITHGKTDEDLANAQRIIKCCNMHDELTAHLKNLYSTCIKMSAISGVKMENKIIEEAIRLAEQK